MVSQGVGAVEKRNNAGAGNPFPLFVAERQRLLWREGRSQNRFGVEVTGWKSLTGAMEL